MKKKQYVSPATRVVQTLDHEGPICASPIFNVQVKDLNNINDFDDEEEAPEQFYFGS